jgi:hypothetical protein
MMYVVQYLLYFGGKWVGYVPGAFRGVRVVLHALILAYALLYPDMNSQHTLYIVPCTQQCSI